MKTKIHQLSTIIHQLARRACGIRALRLHPKFRWLSYACPILQRTQSSSSSCSSSSSKRLLPPPADSPPKLRLRKRRRVSVRRTNATM